jgi:orotidine-5'-phosphate decarboxylase
MLELKEKLIVALDVDKLERAEKIVDLLRERVKFYKIGSQLFTAYGPRAVEMVASKGAEVLLDLKYYDIPNTVYAASASASTIGITPLPAATGANIARNIKPAVFMMTVHIKGGIEMLKRAVEGASQKAKELNIRRPFIVGVTKLTSEPSSEKDVIEAAKIAKEAGLDGVVCSALEAKKIREECGEKFIIVTPGIRPKGSPANDQKRVTTAKEAIEAGANYIVVGRPILEAKDPLKVLDNLLD